MELDIRDWMIVIGVLLFLAVVLDGYRRAQRERKHRVKLARNAGKVRFPEETETTLSELPNGGNKRLISEQEKQQQQQAAVAALNAEDAVDPLFQNPFDVQVAEEAVPEPVLEESFSAIDATETDVVEDLRSSENSEPELILVMHVLATDGENFQGEDLLTILLGCDCRFGEMNIFHRYEAANGKGRIQFSVANVKEPGIFRLDDIKGFSTPGVSFFMRLPGAKEPMEAYNSMVETAQCLVRNLKGVLKDEYHSAMTEQTLEHGRQRIRDYLQQCRLRDHG